MLSFTNDFENLNSVSSCLEKRDQLASQGRFAEIKSLITKASKDEKTNLGKELNVLRKNLQQACDNQIKYLQELMEKDDYLDFDATLTTKKSFEIFGGTLNPVTKTTLEVLGIFQAMGFEVAQGPLIETQDYCFTRLNIPDYHPARSMQDTFFLDAKDELGENLVLRTHTSSVQIRYGKKNPAPIYVVSPGQVYRNEDIDATHDVMFHQIECLIIDKIVSISHLKTLIERFYSAFFGSTDLKVRLRTSYFPYTIPSMEVDISNPLKDNPNSKLYGQEWIEAGGSGLVDPQVIRNIGLDTNEYQGLAFGFGLDRMTQLKHEISGLGQFFNGHLDFLRGSKIPTIV